MKILALYTARFNAFSRRERILITFATLSGILLLGYLILIDGPLSRLKIAQQQVTQQRIGLANIQQQLAVMHVRAQNLGMGEKEKLEKLLQQADEAKQQLQRIGLTLVTPDKVADFLAVMLKRNPAIQLRSLRNLPANDLNKERTNASEQTIQSDAELSTNQMFRHGVEITLVGNYADLLTYIETLEKAPQRVLWGSLQLIVEEYPMSKMTLVVYTLSLDKAWLTL